ncbi:MAG: hypothetical protein WC637_00300 [Victivallales bacterium]|jgi:hypothetical protein
MKIKGVIRVLKYEATGVKIAVESKDLVGQNQFFIPVTAKRFLPESQFEFELEEEKPEQVKAVKKGKK